MPKKKQKANDTADASHDCQAPGCIEPGAYKAPKSRMSLHEYQWYCLDHIRAYNQQWDYFSGMNRDQIEHFMRDALTGHRPTWNRESQVHQHYDRLQDAIDAFMRQSAKARTASPAQLSAKLREALAVMDMEYPYTPAGLKTRYRTLVKKFHPDANKGDRAAEETFKEITVAYLLLTQHINHQ